MYKARKNTNINKHKFYHPATARNRRRLEGLEQSHHEQLRVDSGKKRTIARERVELEYMKLSHPEAISTWQLNWMYNRGPVSSEAPRFSPAPATGLQATAWRRPPGAFPSRPGALPPTSPFPEVKKGGATSRGDAHAAYLEESKRKRRALEEEKMIAEDPVSSFYATCDRRLRETLKDPTFSRRGGVSTRRAQA